MGLTETALIGVGLAMDAVAVSMANGMIYRNLRWRDYGTMLAFFAGFQMLMPVLGYFAGSFFAEALTSYSGIVILLILGAIGGNMIREGMRHTGDCQMIPSRNMTCGVLFFQAVATSIDALAVGIGFSLAHVRIGAAAAEIGIITAVMVAAAIAAGRRFGDALGSRAELLGGIILLTIGIKAIL